MLPRLRCSSARVRVRARARARIGVRATKLTLSLTLSLTLAPTLTLPLTQARCVELFGNESDAEALARLRTARPGVDVAWKQSAREGAEAEADVADGAAGATVPPPVLTRTPQSPRTVGTGYARLPPACGTYLRRRAACPGGRGDEMCTVRIPVHRTHTSLGARACRTHRLPWQPRSPRACPRGRPPRQPRATTMTTWTAAAATTTTTYRPTRAVAGRALAMSFFIHTYTATYRSRYTHTLLVYRNRDARK